MDSESDWDLVIAGLRQGDPEVLQWFCEHYQQALRKIADRRLADGLRARVEPDDIVQSVLRTFLRRAEGGQFTLPDSDRLWRLMCVITLTKVKKHARFHLRQKRSVAREVHLDALGPPDDDRARGLDLPTGAESDPAEQVAFAEEFEQLLASFGDEGRRVAELKLKHHSNAEVAAELGCSERTVRRILKRIRARLEGQSEGE